MLVMIADTAERYISTPLFGDIGADMTDEEKAIAESTPSAPPPAISMPAVTEEAVDFVKQTNTEHSIVIWSLE